MRTFQTRFSTFVMASLVAATGLYGCFDSGHSGFPGGDASVGADSFDPEAAPPGVDVIIPELVGGNVSVPESFVAAPGDVTSIHIADGYLYWTVFKGPNGDAEAPTVFRRSLVGGEVESFATDVYPWGITTDATHAYWLDLHGSGPHTMRRAPIGGGEAVSLDIGGFGGALVVQGGYVYSLVTDLEGKGIGRVPVAGGDTEVVVDGLLEPSHLTSSGDDIIWVDSGDGDVEGTIGRLTDGGSESEIIATFPPALFPSRVAAANDRFYFGTKSRYYGAAAADGSYEVYDSGSFGGVAAVAADKTGLYLAINARITRSPAELGEESPVVIGDDDTIDLLAISTSHVYWTLRDGAIIYRVPKPWTTGVPTDL